MAYNVPLAQEKKDRVVRGISGLNRMTQICESTSCCELISNPELVGGSSSGSKWLPRGPGTTRDFAGQGEVLRRIHFDECHEKTLLMLTGGIVLIFLHEGWRARRCMFMGQRAFWSRARGGLVAEKWWTMLASEATSRATSEREHVNEYGYRLIEEGRVRGRD